ncbi:respiratory nitrate reductase subunit gamma [Mycobacterium tuberculosis]
MLCTRRSAPRRSPVPSAGAAAGAPAGFATLLGVGLLIYRRRIRTSVWLATTRNDKLMYLVLVCAIVAGWHTR